MEENSTEADAELGESSSLLSLWRAALAPPRVSDGMEVISREAGHLWRRGGRPAGVIAWQSYRLKRSVTF